MAAAADGGTVAAGSSPPSLPLRVLTCQTDGALGPTVEDNISRWSSILEADESLTSATIEVIHFPETAFCRYFYSSSEDLTDYGGAEEAGDGAVFAFFRTLALKFDAYVIAGFAEKDGTAACFYNSCGSRRNLAPDPPQAGPVPTGLHVVPARGLHELHNPHADE